MPAKSKKQFRLMAMIAKDAKGIGGLKGISAPKGLKGKGIPISVARDFVKKTPKKKRSLFSRGR